MNERITMSSPDLDESDFQGVLEVLRSGRLALGAKAEEFERIVAEYLGVKHGVTVSSGTAGLHLLVCSLGLGPGDEVLVPSFTFAASVNVILYEKAVPVFVDIEPDTYNMDPDDLERKITPHCKAIMAVDVFGHPVEWDSILRIASENNLKVIDDSCEALGAEYKGRKLGLFGEAAVFAFYPNKQMTTGEGGLIVTNDEQIAHLARSLRNQGRREMGAWLEHERLGYNYRLDEMSAALGVSQFRRLEQFLRKREQVAQIYAEKLQTFDWVRMPEVRSYVRKSWFVYVVELEEGIDRDEVVRALGEEGIPSRGYFPPVHEMPYVRSQAFPGSNSLPVTEKIAKRTIALPFHNNMDESDIDVVTKALSNVVRSVSSK